MASPRGGDDPESTPICRCRVLYLGSAVPHVTKDGLQGIQEPLRELYPEQGALGARGIDSWLSVWSNGLLLENVDENHKKVTRFFPIDSLHYCAAVRYVLVPERAAGAALSGGGSGTLLSTTSSGGGPSPRFLPLDSPFARAPNPSHPPLFAAILRRTTGIKVLECHAFICKREMAANALVRCCFHAYADSSYARHIDGGGGPGSTYGTLRSSQGGDPPPGAVSGGGPGPGAADSWRRSTLSLNNGGTLTSNKSAVSAVSAGTDDVSIYNGDENHKVWVGSGTLERDEVYGGGGSSTVRSSRSTRPRQVVAPVNSPPPPPTPKEEKASKKATNANTKDRKARRKNFGGSREDLVMMNGGSGSLLRPHSSLSAGPHRFVNGAGGSLLRHTNGYHHAPHHYVQAPPPPHMVLATLPARPRHAKARPQQQQQPPAPGKVLLQPMPLLAPVAAAATGRRRPQHAPVVVPLEEPVYMPSARPMSPVASFQPAHFPHEAYLMQQYATVEHPGRHAKKKATKHKPAAVPAPALVPVPVVQPVPPPHVLVNGGGAAPDEDEIAVLAEDSTSPFNTGIYRKKGHLNERAFSYSIRQEHRSRSYGSLANLKFSGPDFKKEREIAQMMHDLELSSGDELERSEVPAHHHHHHHHHQPQQQQQQQQRGSLRNNAGRR